MTNREYNGWPSPPELDENDQPDLEPQEAELEEIEEVDELAQVAAERDDFLDQLQRSRAEFLNFKRRNDQERAQLRQFVARDVLAQFLPVIDDLDRALVSIPEVERGSGWVKGVRMIQDKLHATAERLGVTMVESLGQPFDPSLHEAVATEPGSTGSTVVEVYQNGYRIGDMLVRPAMVKTGDPVDVDTNVEADSTETEPGHLDA